MLPEVLGLHTYLPWTDQGIGSHHDAPMHPCPYRVNRPAANSGRPSRSKGISVCALASVRARARTVDRAYAPSDPEPGIADVNVESGSQRLSDIHQSLKALRCHRITRALVLNRSTKMRGTP